MSTKLIKKNCSQIIISNKEYYCNENFESLFGRGRNHRTFSEDIVLFENLS